MRALQMTGPSRGAERTEVVEKATPRPGPGELTIDVTYAGINFIDVMARRGDAGYVQAWPYVPGLEVTGTVRETGPGVGDLAPGRRVAALTSGGGLAEVAVADRALTVPLPDAVPPALAAAAPLVLSTAYLLLADAARFRPGDSVLVHSASGGVGGAVAGMIAALGGGPRLGTVGRPDKAEPARRLGYDAVYARDGGSGPLADAVRADTGGAGADIVLDPLGTGLIEADLAMTAPGGRIVLFGNAAGGAPPSLPPVHRLMGGNVSIGGFSISRLAATAPRRVAEALRRVLDLIAEGRLDLPFTEVESLDRVAEIHSLLAGGRGQGKYVVRATRCAAE